jgi:hypothetical protein
MITVAILVAFVLGFAARAALTRGATIPCWRI